MAVEADPHVRDGIMAVAAAAAGRALLLARVKRHEISVERVLRTLLVEVPLTAGTALLGWALCRALELDGPRQIVAIALLARYGAERLEFLFDRVLPRTPRA